jgi:hypothetical protein
MPDREWRLCFGGGWWGIFVSLTDKAVKPWVQGITALHEMLRIKEGAGRLVRPA